MTDTPHDGNKLPDGVGAVMRSPDGSVLNVLDPFLSDNRWPGVGVDSGSFKKLSRPEKFYAQAVAFLQATKILCETAGESGEDLRWSQGSVCFYCLNLATELFLKACISRASGGSASPIHELSKLTAQYSEILTEPEFQFPTPWALSVSDIEGALGAQIFNSISLGPIPRRLRRR